MTGAGAASLAFAKETEFMGSLVDADSDSTPDYFKFGRNPELTELDLDNQLERLAEADVVEDVASIAGKIDGALGVSAVVSADTFADVLEIVFNDGGTNFTHGLASTAAIYAGIDYIGGTAERALVGCIPTDFSITYNTDENTVTYSVTFLYADETLDTAINPSSITGPTDGNDVPFHGFSLQIDGTSVSKLQSTTVSIGNIAKYMWGASRTPDDAVIAKPETTLDATAIFGGPSRLERAYGAADATSPQDSLSSVSASVELSAAGNTVATFDLPKVTPATYSWENLIGEEDLTDPTTFNVDGGVSVTLP